VCLSAGMALIGECVCVCVYIYIYIYIYIYMIDEYVFGSAC